MSGTFHGGQRETPTEIRREADTVAAVGIDMAVSSDNITSEVVIIDHEGRDMPFRPGLLQPTDHAMKSCHAPRSWEWRLVAWT